MKIYTKTGDKGQTSLIGGTRVSKADLRIDCYGTIDELNAHIGLIACQDINPHYKSILKEIQDRLFTMGAFLAYDFERSKKEIPDLQEEDIVLLENEMDKMTAVLAPLRHFVLPGGNTLVAQTHVARCVCRRAERLTVLLAENQIVEQKIIRYLNRLSDYLFVLGRKLTLDTGAEENIWIPRLK